MSEQESVDNGVKLIGINADSEEDQSDGDEVVLIKTSAEEEQLNEEHEQLNRRRYCGFLCCHPKWLQVFANKKVFTLLLFLFAVVEGSIVSGFTSIALSSLEKRYKFTSTAVGFVAVSYDTMAIFTSIIISFLGSRPGSHKPRWIGGSLLVLGFGAFTFASPQFMFGSYESKPLFNSTIELCEDNQNFTTACTPANDLAYFTYIIGNVFVAIGAASMYTLGPTFIDEIVHPKFVSLHIGAYQVGGLVGPAFGYLMGSLFLRIYVDPWEKTTLTPSDPAWVGGWWMGFILAGVLSVLLSIPFFMYPKTLSDSHIVRKAREKEMAVRSITGQEGMANRCNLFKKFLNQFKRILLNKSFMLQSFSVAVLFVVVTGMVSFGPHYLETQFHFTASTSGLLVGGVGITASSLGMVSGALIVHFMELSRRKLAGFITVVLMLLILATPALLIRCDYPPIAGVSIPYANGSRHGVDGASCNTMCDCTSTVYEPVCGADGLTYFSPCRAGCKVHGGDSNFTQCLCIAESIYYGNNGTIELNILLNSNYSSATNGVCQSNCNTYTVLFIFVLLVTFFFAFLAHVPVIYFTMRVVADEERSFALGIQASIGRIFGSIPGPLLFGAVFDSTCIKWQEICGHHGNCWIYNTKNLSRGLLYVCLPCVFLSAVLAFLAWIFYPKPLQQASTSAANDSPRTAIYSRTDEEESSASILN